MPYIYFDADQVLPEFSSDEIADEAERRGLDILSDEIRELVSQIHTNRSLGKDYTQQLDDLIYNVMGRVSCRP